MRHSKHSTQLKESWQSNKYDFSDPNVRLEYVSEMGCSVGGCISALKRSWKAYRIAGRNGEPGLRSDLAYRIVSIQTALGIERSDFPELEGMNIDEELEELQAKREEKEESGGGGGGEWNLNLNSGSEPYTEEWTEEDKQLLKEEREGEDDWWFS